MRMSELPSGWVTAPIGDLCTLKNGRAFKPSDWSATGVPIVRIQNLNNPEALHNYYQGNVDDRNRLRGGELLFAWSGTPGTSFGAHIWRGGEAVLNQHIFRVDFDNAALDKRFFRFAINAKLDDLIGVAHGGVGLRHVTKGVFERTPILLPPRAEQSRIADQLDTLLARIQACQDRLDAIPALLKRFRQAVLSAAVSGELTASWRETRGAKAWVRSTVGEVTSSSFYGPRFSKDQYTMDVAGVPTIRTTDMDRDGRIHVTPDTPRVLVPDERLDHFGVRPGDLLVTRTGSIGTMAVFEGGFSAIPSAYLIRFRFTEHVRSRFMYFVLAAPQGQRALGLSSTAVTQPNVNAEAIKRISFGLPSQAEQDEIIARVGDLFRLADRIEFRLRMVTVQAQRLSPLTLSKAFRGELVEQDPKDEPASQLLARLAESRDAQPRPARGRKRGAGAQPSTSQPNDVPDWLALPDRAWACPPDPEGLRASVLLTAVLRAWGGREAPQSQARLAYLLCEQPRLLSAVLPEALAQQWQRLVGDEARPVSAEVSVLQPAVNIAWRRAVIGMRARGDLLDLGAGADAKWALGAGADAIETKGWPQGRAGFVVGYLRAHGIESVLPTLEPAQREFVDARAA